MKSYREPDERPGDKQIYFSYERSLRARRAPIRWKTVLGWMLVAGIVGFVRWFVHTGDLRCSLMWAAIASLVGLGMIPVLREQRALSDEAFAEAVREPNTPHARVAIASEPAATSTATSIEPDPYGTGPSGVDGSTSTTCTSVLSLAPWSAPKR